MFPRINFDRSSQQKIAERELAFPPPSHLPRMRRPHPVGRLALDRETAVTIS